MKQNVKTYKQFINEDVIPGGLADLRKPGEFNQTDLEYGITKELEHTSDPNIAKEIAMDHLTEDPSYYKKLSVVEDPKLNNYMFFNGLVNIKRMVDELLQIDPKEIDILLNEHDWASHHMSTSNDDITEIFQFIIASLNGEMNEKIKHQGGRWLVFTKDGKKLLGSHETRKEARAQLAAIEIAKNKGK